jgi:hypothetical protein
MTILGKNRRKVYRKEQEEERERPVCKLVFSLLWKMERRSGS